MDCENKTNVQTLIFYNRRAIDVLCNRPPSAAQLTDFCGVTSVMARVVVNVFIFNKTLVLASSN